MNNSAEDVMVRSNLYGLLAFGFSYPDLDQYAQIVDGAFRKDVMCCIEHCMPGKRGAVIADGLRVAGSSLADFEADYLNSFQTNMPTPSASLYESEYVKHANKAHIMLELRAFYENFGLAVAETSHELEDTLTGELEFMHFLAAKEAQSLIEEHNVEPYVLAQHDFLSRHLAVWIPEFRRDVAKKSIIDFYRTLAEITELLVGYEAERLSHVRPGYRATRH